MKSAIADAIAEGGAEDVARRLERAAFNRAASMVRSGGGACHWGSPRFENCYRSSALSMVRNAAAAADRAGRLSAEARGGEAKARCRAQAMTPWELRPDLWADLERSLELKENAMNGGRKQESNTSAYRCKLCGSRECWFQELQTRSGDEMSSVFVTCLACDHRWRVA